MQRIIATAVLVLLLAAVPAAAAEFDLSKLKDGGYVVLLRHVTAGGSDSDDFDLKDCRTQRQVGPSGRSEAEALATRFKAAGITAARVLSSQWCRALQTAALLGLGPVVEEPALNYYHWRLGGEAAMNEALRAYFVALEAPPPGAPLVLVAHTTAFKAIGVEAPKAGGGVVLRPNGTDRPEVVGEIAAPE
ncbi:MAG TPA: histidine phosphatase family protein [Kiloniellaceae bacterium]|nr:histidine phosphatase family protein [Kiloniellaceae bacterium]